jgi:hypothetical protein
VRGFKVKRWNSVEEIAELHFLDKVVVVIDALPVQTQANPNSCPKHLENWSNARSQPQVGGGLVGHAEAS